MTLKNLEDFEKDILKSKKTVLVDFWAPWCGPCKMIAPILEEVSTEINELNIVKINIDENKDLAIKYNIMSIPTLLIFKNGEVVANKAGFSSKENLIEWINSIEK